MINITLYDNGFEATGHARAGQFNNEPCARVTTVGSMIEHVFLDKVSEDSYGTHGKTYIMFTSLTASQKKQLHKMQDYFLSLEKAYSRMIQVSDRRD